MSTAAGDRLNEAAAETEDEDQRERETPTVSSTCSTQNTITTFKYRFI